MNVCANRDQLERLVHDRLPEADRVRIAAHIESCAFCQEVVEQLTRAPSAAAGADSDRTSTDFDQGLLERLEACGPLLVDDDADKTSSFVSDRMEALPEQSPINPQGPDRRGPARHSQPAIAGFRIIREIGRGGMGVVYEAVEETLSRRVALKVLPANALSDVKQVQRFEREAKAAARLHHTNIVPVFGVGQEGGHHYYVMQYIDGLGLDAVLIAQRLRQAELVRRQSVPAESTEEPSRPDVPAADEARGRPEITPAAVARSLETGSFPDAGVAGLDREVNKSGASETAVLSPPPIAAARAAIPLSARLTGSSEPMSHPGLDRRYLQSVARIGLRVAEALEYANSQGVLHRDIKPSNLLLDTSGNVWVTDFGLAKTADADDLTQTGDILGTLRYMASERFEGECDARSDVFSLGLTLYELIALKPAYEGSDRFDLIDRLRHEEPPRLKKLVPGVPRDLETIIHKASSLEPKARYQTAGAMADDLRRFIEDRPIEARRVSTTERCLRWCRRNRWVAATLGFLVVVLIAWTGTATLLWRRADRLRTVAEERRVTAESNQQEADAQRLLAEAGFTQARAAVDEFLNKVTDNQLLTAPGLQPLRRDLLSSALAFYLDFIDKRSGDPGLHSALADVHLRVGKIQTELGAKKEARRAFLAARSIYERLANAKPGDHSVQAGLADSLVKLDAMTDGIDLWERLVSAEPKNLHYLRNLADAYNALGNAQSDLRSDPRKAADALQSHQKALDLRRTVVQALPADPQALSGYGASLNNIGVLLSERNPGGALDMYVRATTYAEAAFARVPQVIAYGQFLGNTYNNVAQASYRVGQRGEAIRWQEKCVAHWRRLAHDNPEVPVFAARLHSALIWQAQVFRELGRTADSTRAEREAAVIADRKPAMTTAGQGTKSAQEKLREQQELLKDRDLLASENPGSQWNRVDLGASQLAVGQIQSDLERYDEAEATLKKSLAVYESLVRDKPESARYRLDVGLVHMALATVEWRARRLNEADRETTIGLKLMEDALRAEPASSALRVELDNTRIDAADRLLKAGLWEEASALLEPVYRREPNSLLRTGGLTWSTHAALRLLAGDAPGYRASCTKFYEEYNKSESTRFNLFRACLAGPGAIADLRALAAVAETEAVATSYDNWYLLLAAILCARAGEFQKAQANFDRIRPDFAQASYIVPARALVQFRLGHHEKARELLVQSDRFAEETFRGVLATPVQAAAFPYAEVNLMFEVLRRDAHAQIEGKPTADVPWRHLFRGRLLASMGRFQEAEASFTAALAVRPLDARVRFDHARVLTELARQSASASDRSAAHALIDRSLVKWPNDPDLLRACGDVSASRGEWDKAAAALKRFLAARPDFSPKCYLAGWWVAGPEPFKPGDLGTPGLLDGPPSSGPSPDPFEPLPKSDATETLSWRSVTPDTTGYLNLGALMSPADNTSAYVLTRVYAPAERDTVLLTACDDEMHMWTNGTLVSRQKLHYQDTAIPVHMRAGWNTVLVRVNNSTKGYMLRLRFSESAEQIARGFSVYLDQNRWNIQTAEVLSGLYAVLPPNPAAWAPRAWLDAEVVRRGDVFPRVLALRPADGQLWLARGRYLAWLGRWADAVAAYDRAIHNRLVTEDSHDEYASILLLKGERAAYQRWCEQLATRALPNSAPWALVPLVRAGALAPHVFDDASTLVRWAEPIARADSKGPHARYVFGLANLRAGRFDEAVQSFEVSLADPRHWLDVNNWLGLALAHHHLGHAALARRWLKQASNWIDQRQGQRAGESVAYVLPGSLTDWVEILVLRCEAEALIIHDPVFPVHPFDLTSNRHLK